MIMKIAFDTYRDILFGDTAVRVPALFTLAIWIVTATYIVSTVSYYVAPSETFGTSLAGGFIISGIISIIKFS